MQTKRKVYFAGTLSPQRPGTSGGEIREYHLLRTLLDWANVWGTWLFPNTDGGTTWRGVLQNIRLARRPMPNLQAKIWWHASRAIGWWWARHWPLLTPWPAEVTYYAARWRATLLKQLSQDLHTLVPDIFMISPQVNPLPLLIKRRGANNTRWVLSTFDVEAERLPRLAQAYHGLARWAAKWDAQRALAYEKALLKRIDGVIAVSKRDRETLVEKYEISPPRVWVAANGVDIQFFSFQPPPPPAPPTVLFVGTLGYPANHLAARRLIQRIMPRVRQSIPQARLWLVGRSPKPSLLKLLGPSDFVFANVPDVRPYYRQAQVICVPLEIGSGTKLKVLEALSVGRVVVATSVALEGLALQPEEHLFLGDDDEALANKIAAVLQAPHHYTPLRRRARQWVEHHYAWEVTMAGLTEWLEHLLQLPPRRVS